MRLLPSDARRGRAFTLVELVVVLVILGLLASLGTFAFTSVRSSVNDGKARDLLRSISSAQQAAYANRGAFVASLPPATSPGFDDTGNPLPAPTIDRYADLQKLAPNKYGYVDAETQPTKPLEVSVAKSRAYGSIPVIGLATLSDSGRCAIRATFPLDTGRTALESIVEKTAIASCTGANALVKLNTGIVIPGEEVPGAPTNLVVAPGPGLLNLSWSPVTQASGYRIYRTAPGQNEASFLTDITGATTYGDYGLSATYGPDDEPATYAYYVVAYNAKGYSLASSTATGTPTEPSTDAPTAPWSLRATSVDSTGVVLTWTPGKNTTSFRITRDGSPIKNAAGTETGYLSPEGGNYATTFKDTGIVAGGKYAYRVTGYSASSPGNDQTSTTLTVITPPAAPASLSAAAKAAPPNVGSCGPAACVTLTWPAAPAPAAIVKAPATGYRLYRCEAAACPANAASDVTALTPVTTVDPDTLSYTDTGLSGSTDYKYFVAAANSAGASWVAPSVTVKTVPSAPTGFTARGAASGRNDLSWTAPANTTVTSYQVWLQSPRQTWDLIGTSATTTYSHTLSGAVATRYKYRVAAVSAAGAGLPSNSDTAVPYPLVPDFTRAVATEQDRVELSWPYRNGLTYTLTRNGTKIAEDISAGTYTDTTVVAGQKYTYRLTASNGTSSTAGAPVDVLTPPDRVVDLVAKTKVVNGTATQTLTWPAAPGASSYKVFSCAVTDAGKACTSPSLLATVTTNSYQRSGTLSIGGTLAPATRYSFAIAAIANSSEGPASPVATTATTPAVPANLTAVKTNGNLVYSWDASPLAEFYAVVTNATNPTEGETIVQLVAEPGVDRPSVSIPMTAGSTPGTGWAIVAGNEAGLSAGARVPAPTGDTDAPSNLRATDTGTAVELRWTGQATTDFEVRRCSGDCDPTSTTAPGAVLLTYAANPGSTTSSLRDATAGRPELYTYAVRTRSAGTWTPWSTPVAITTALAAPRNVTVTRSGMGRFAPDLTYYTSMSVTWDPVPGAARYVVYVNGSYAAFQSAEGPEQIRLSLVRPGSYARVEVRAIAANGGSSLSSLPTETYNLQAPLELNLDSVGAGGAGGAALSWNRGPTWNRGPENLAEYRVYRCTTGGCDPTVYIGSTTTNTFRDPNAHTFTQGSSYKVISINSYGEISPDSNVVSFRRANPPENFRVTGYSPNGPDSAIPTLSWDFTVNAAMYRVIDINDQEVCVTTATSCSDPRAAVAAGQTRQFRVAMIHSDGGVGLYSNPALTAYGTLPRPAAAPLIVATVDRGFTLQWPATAGADRYQVTRHVVDPLNPDVTLSSVTYSATSTAHTDLGPWAGAKTYVWSYTACNAAGCSAASPRSVTKTANYRQIARTDATSSSYFALDAVLGTGGWTDAWENANNLANSATGGGASVFSATGGLLGGGMSLRAGNPSKGVLGYAGAPGSNSSDLATISGSTSAGDYTLSTWFKANADTALGNGDLLALGAPRSSSELSLRPSRVGWTEPEYRTDNGYQLADGTQAWGPAKITTTAAHPADLGFDAAAKSIAAGLDTSRTGAGTGALGSIPLGKHYLRRDFTLNAATANTYLYVRCPNAEQNPETTGTQTATSRGVSCAIYVDGVAKGNPDQTLNTISLGTLAAGKHSVAVLFDHDNQYVDSSAGIGVTVRTGTGVTAPVVRDSTGALLVSDERWRGYGKELTWRSGAYAYALAGTAAGAPGVNMIQNGSDAYDASGTGWTTAKTATGAPDGVYWPTVSGPLPASPTRAYFRKSVYFPRAGTYTFTLTGNQISRCDLTIDGGKYSTAGAWSTGTALSDNGTTCAPAPTGVSQYVPAGYHMIAISALPSTGSTAAGAAGILFHVKSGTTFVAHIGGIAGTGTGESDARNTQPFAAMEVASAPTSERGDRVLTNTSGAAPTSPPSVMGGQSSGDPMGGTNLNFGRYGGYDPLFAQPNWNRLEYGGPTAQTWSGAPSLTDGRWHHVAIIVNADGRSSQAFIDGIGGPVVSTSSKNVKYWAVGHSTDFRASTGPFAPTLTNPTVAPTVQALVPASVTLADTSRNAARRGLASVDGTWVSTNSGTNDLTVTSYDKTTGALSEAARAMPLAKYVPVDYTKTSTHHYVLTRNESVATPRYHLLRFDFGWTLQANINVENFNSSNRAPAIFSNNTGVYIARNKPDGTSLHVRLVSNADTATTSGTNSVNGAYGTLLDTTGAGSNWNADVTGFMIGTADFGARYVVAAWEGGIRVYTWASGTAYLSRDTSKEWTLATYPGTSTTAPVKGFTWDGSRFAQLDDRGNVYLYSTQSNDTTHSVQSTWTYDDAEGTGRHETGLSPAATFTQPKRQWFTVTAPPPPASAPDVSDRGTRYYIAGNRQGERADGLFAAIEGPSFGPGPDLDPVIGISPTRQAAFGDYDEVGWFNKSKSAAELVTLFQAGF